MLRVEFKVLIPEVAKKSKWQNLRFALAAGSRQGSGGQCSLRLEIIDDMTLSLQEPFHDTENMAASKRIVVCGGGGFLGSRICKSAVARGWHVTSIKFVSVNYNHHNLSSKTDLPNTVVQENQTGQP